MKIIEIPASTREVVDCVICDFCKNIIKNYSNYRINDVIVSHKEGDSYPESGFGTEKIFDFCDDCFENKLVKWLAEQGCFPKITEWNY